jgi:1,4-dihydroxy-2-naphthoate octaprenyltransferase
MKPKLLIFFLATRPKFLVASAAPVLVGSAAGFAAAGTFSPLLFVLAILAAMFLHSGANLANDYFDHLSRNDWLNTNATPFSGGSRYIQENILPAKTILTLSLSALAIGAILGVAIVVLTGSIFILILGVIGLLGGFFYTAPPIKLGYRCLGEPAIALLFGILPVYGAYYLQTETVDIIPLFPAVIVAILIFLVILINEFPDADADAAVNKRTLVVRFGIPVSIWIYRTTLLVSIPITIAAMLIYRPFILAGPLYLLTIPLMITAVKSANKKDLATPGQYRASQLTVLLHITGSAALTIGFIISGLAGYKI